MNTRLKAVSYRSHRLAFRVGESTPFLWRKGFDIKWFFHACKRFSNPYNNLKEGFILLFCKTPRTCAEILSHIQKKFEKYGVSHLSCDLRNLEEEDLLKYEYRKWRTEEGVFELLEKHFGLREGDSSSKS